MSFSSNQNGQPLTITIHGPAGAGKTYLQSVLAEVLGSLGCLALCTDEGERQFAAYRTGQLWPREITINTTTKPAV